MASLLKVTLLMLQNILWTGSQFVIVIVFLVIGLLICQMHKSEQHCHVLRRCTLHSRSPDMQQTLWALCIESQTRSKWVPTCSYFISFCLPLWSGFGCHASNLFATSSEPLAHGVHHCMQSWVWIQAFLASKYRKLGLKLYSVKAIHWLNIAWMKATLVFWIIA